MIKKIIKVFRIYGKTDFLKLNKFKENILMEKNSIDMDENPVETTELNTQEIFF